MVIQYAYRYDEKFDVYTVRRLDDECLNYHVPVGLLLNIYNAGQYDKEVLKSLQSYAMSLT